MSEPVLRDEEVRLPAGPHLAVRRGDGRRRPYLLVHGLASNARTWDGVAHALVGAGHEVVAVDQRGHGRSEAPADGYDTDTCADDLAALCAATGLVRERAPIVVGQSWGGNVVLSLAARHGGVAAVACVDGGWIRLADRFPDPDAAWRELAPPRLDGLTYDDLETRIRTGAASWPAAGVEGTLANLERTPDGGVRARLAREHHRSILASLWAGDPRRWYPRVHVPVLLVPAVAPPGDGDGSEATAARARARSAVEEALALLPHARVVEYAGAHHDLHAEQPERLAADLLGLADLVAEPAGVRAP